MDPLHRVVLMSARDAFSSQAEIDRQWQKLNFTDPPDFEPAVEEHGHLVEILHGFGIETVLLPHADGIPTRRARLSGGPV